MDIIRYLLCFYIILKPFYFWSSGLPQISDFVLLLAFILSVLLYKRKKIRDIVYSNRCFFYFFIFVLVINLFYSLIYSVNKSYDNFNIHSLYYLFDGLGIITFSLFFKNDKKSFSSLSMSLKITLFLQLILFVFGVGKYYDAIRYEGTFNDPNQFAYFILLAYCFIYLLSIKTLKQRWNFIYFLIALLLILESSSTGMFAAMCLIFILSIIIDLKRNFRNIKKPIVIFDIGCIIVGMLLAIYSLNPNQAIGFTNLNIPIFSRLETKIAQATGSSDITFFQERGYDRIYYYPQYLLFGAGEGGYYRWGKAYHQLELHATLPSILFCYGVVPLFLILKWGYKKIRKIDARAMCIVAVVVLESFTLINSRQVLFWVFFILTEFLFINNGLKEKTNESNQ